jgi:type IV fimbrial biogenesis protein FimT
MRDRGFTLVELMIGMVILAILLLLALPSYREFMGNTRIRNVADSLAQGVRLAQVEAIKRNENVTFEIDGSPATGWTIRDAAATAVHTELFSDAAGQIVVDPRPAGAVKLTYTGIGQYVPGNNPDDGTDAITSIRVTSTLPSPHDLRVATDPSLGVGVRVCDKRFAPGDPIGCPAGLP